ncbi:MAG: LysR family transcriptional regulator [Actinobacteria bacterium]|nr:LysR family transcriptional regulator [Actinomycetota bacterium]
MRLEQLDAFVEVSRRGSVSQAAEALFVTQPTLTARIKGLERELDAILFIRSGRGMRLSEAGRTFLPYAERSLDAAAMGRRVLVGLARGETGHLDLGAAPAVSTYVLPTILTHFRRTNPKVALAVRTGHSEEVLELVLREQVQVGLGRSLRHPDVEAIPLYDDELVLVVHPEHSFAGQVGVGAEQINDVQLILFDRTSSYHRLTSEFFQRLGAVPRGVMELDNIDAAKKMVEHGLGVALLPHTAVAGELEGGTLNAVTLADAPSLARSIVVLRKRNAGPPTVALDAFLHCLSDLRPALQQAAARR